MPVRLWDALAGSASPNFHGPGPSFPLDDRSGLLLLGWHHVRPRPCCLLELDSALAGPISL